MYRLYDVLKTPFENTCNYIAIGNDPEHKDLQGSGRGFQVYPQKAGQIHCNEPEDEDDDNVAVSDFLWSADSSKVVFADVKSGAISLILVTMPADKEGHPRTSIYTFTGANDVCAGAANCDYNNVKSVAWNGSSIKVSLIRANPGGKAIEKDLTVPVRSFVPIGRDASHPEDGTQGKTQ